MARVKVPVGSGIPRWMRVGKESVFVALEDVMADNLDLLFPGMEVETSELFRVVRNANTERDVRLSTGFGFHAGPAFLIVGFPLNTDNLTAVVALGLRIPGTGVRW